MFIQNQVNTFTIEIEVIQCHSYKLKAVLKKVIGVILTDPDIPLRDINITFRH